MAVTPSPFGPKPQFVDAAGSPDLSYKLFFYAAGSNTKQNTYTDSTGGTPNANPMILNVLGQPATEIWWTVGQFYKVVLAPSTDTDPPTNPVWTIDNLQGMGTVTTSTTQDEWLLYAGTPTFVNGTTFTVTGDQTAIFQVNRRVKTMNTAGTVYGVISASVFGAVTTVTVVNDSGALDSGLSLVSYGLLSATNPSIPETTVGKAVRIAATALAARTALGFTSAVIDRTYGEYLTNAAIATVIPLDDTIPQVGEGTQIISVSLTPKSITNRLRLRFLGQVTSGAATNAIAAVFSSASANALAADFISISTSDIACSMVLEHEYVPGVTTPLTFTVRVGPSAGSIRMNGASTARLFGGVAKATLVVEEITA